MASVASILAFAALIGALVSWVVGATFFVRTLNSLDGNQRLAWFTLVAWPFAVKRLDGAAAENAAKVNKALVAFMVCLLIAGAAGAAATNLHRIAK